jgi:HME family heavy-metal exporter
VVGVEASSGASRRKRKPIPLPVPQRDRQREPEVRSGILYATVIIILVFVPLFALSGIEGAYLPLGVAYRFNLASC